MLALTGALPSIFRLRACPHSDFVQVLDGLVTLGGSVVLMVELEWYYFLVGHSAGNSIPGWSVTVLLLAGSLWLCWVGYTVQCRRMVLSALSLCLFTSASNYIALTA